MDIQGFTDCPKYPENSQDFDLSNLEFELNDQGTIVINGPLTILNDIVSPAPLTTTIERLQRGQWRRSMFSHDVADFCASLQDPSQIYYSVTSKMEQQSCPFKPGHTERLVNVTIDMSSYPLTPQLTGDWRFMTKNKKGNCSMLLYSLIEH